MKLLMKIERFLRDTGMAPTRFGRNVTRDPRLVFDLRRGRTPMPRTERRVERYIAEYQREAA